MGDATSVRRGTLVVVYEDGYITTWIEIGGEKVRTLTVHAPSDFSGLLVAPADGREVGLVVHEAAVEEGRLVRIARLDVDLSMSL